MKKALDITTKGWSKKDISKLNEKIKSQNYKWRGKAVTQNGKIKYFFTYTEVDAVDYCIKHGMKLLETKPNDL